MSWKLIVTGLLALAVFQPQAFADALEGKKSSAEILAEAPDKDWLTLEQDNLLYIEVASGRAIVALSDTLAQNHVAQIKTLARQGFYDGLSFYRVIDGFVAQGGDPFEERSVGDAKESLAAEFEESYSAFRERTKSFSVSPFDDGYADGVGFANALPVGLDQTTQTVWHLHCTGAFAFGRNNERDSASTEFYIALQPQRYLDRNLTVFGRVIDGMEHIQRLRRNVPPASKDEDVGDTIISMRLGSDLTAGEQKHLQLLKSDSNSFAAFVEARANRPEEFFYYRPKHIDICQLPIPVREAPQGSGSE
ncbi:peptidylprolyl isomerase [Hyphococcus flavus]|uniref:peptidylprolyl isomerase n=1 Tax=Hyphococcus flavus TaxID=1866326 RepID=A0AAE9ZA40_9PROT|nr:peptidylprolyl isomerase [Hyphococcus flavus]WDI30259.1 peptidylprolyl isomerase [Hyphococcus flavus]